MKVTEGYWLMSERANASHAAQVCEVIPVPGGVRVLAATAPVNGRGDTVNLATITVEFVAWGEDRISVEAWHYEAYGTRVPSLPKHAAVREDVRLSIGGEEIVLDAGRVLVRIRMRPFSYAFEAEGRVLTGCGEKNLSYIRLDRRNRTMNPEDDYLAERCQPYIRQELFLSVGECVYGFGERFTPFVKNGQVVETWNEDGGTSSGVAYKSVPFYLTNRGYGVLVDSTDRVSFEVGSEKVSCVGFSVPGERLRYVLFYGPSPREILRSYTGLTGRPALPPAWSFGLWLSTSFTTSYDEETVTSFIEGMEERDIPLSVFHFDCFWMREFHWCDFTWDERYFPDIKRTLWRLHQRGLHICVWINPYIAQGTRAFDEAVKGGYLLMRADGRGVWQTDLWQAGMGIVDFTNPEAEAWYTGKLRELLDCGVDCFKTDFGERIPIDVVYHDGSDPRAMHNYYSFLYNRAVFRLLVRERGGEEAVVFARSATAGGQQFPVHWGGDCSASYPSMAETLRGGLSFAMSGFAFWSHDISGFEQTATPDLYKRWAAFGLLSTHSRLHGSVSYRVPWAFDEEAGDVLRFFVKLKCRLMPYLYQKAAEAHREGIPVMRPMVFEYPDDPAVPYLDRQYLLGEALLVAPVFSEDHTADYYLPEGVWTGLLDGSCREGGRWYRGTYDYFSLPLYVRENTILVLGSVDTQPDYDYSDRPTLLICQPQEGAELSAVIPDLAGDPICTVRAARTGDRIRVWVEGPHTAMEAELRVGGTRTAARIPEDDSQLELVISGDAR